MNSRKHPTAEEEAMSVVERHAGKIMRLKGVVGIGVGKKNDEFCIVVCVEKRTPDLMKALPKELDGYEVVVEEVGKIKAL